MTWPVNVSISKNIFGDPSNASRKLGRVDLWKQAVVHEDLEIQVLMIGNLASQHDQSGSSKMILHRHRHPNLDTFHASGGRLPV